ncbi:MAG: hypothetical protein JWM39_634 [Parcubacteria group bacterium]|nr:hypothetical protein [Parcubacteria group bacterium]
METNVYERTGFASRNNRKACEQRIKSILDSAKSGAEVIKRITAMGYSPHVINLRQSRFDDSLTTGDRVYVIHGRNTIQAIL